MGEAKENSVSFLSPWHMEIVWHVQNAWKHGVKVKWRQGAQPWERQWVLWWVRPSLSHLKDATLQGGLSWKREGRRQQYGSHTPSQETKLIYSSLWPSSLMTSKALKPAVSGCSPHAASAPANMRWTLLCSLNTFNSPTLGPVSLYISMAVSQNCSSCYVNKLYCIWPLQPGKDRSVSKGLPTHQPFTPNHSQPDAPTLPACQIMPDSVLVSLKPTALLMGWCSSASVRLEGCVLYTVSLPLLTAYQLCRPLPCI